LTKIYTHTGDEGMTSLSGGRRVPKHSLRVEAYGSVDEAIAWIGMLRSEDTDPEMGKVFVYIQDQLMRCAATLANDNTNPRIRQVTPDDDCSDYLEKEIDKMDELLTPLRNFILPGGSIIVSHCHIARCVCRRAERAVLRLNVEEEVPPIVIRLLNRLSDFLFTLARFYSLKHGNEDVIWTV
jgi:cob(I)alamin adenosyltransferase